MKTKISRIGKKSLSVVIALMMIVSTMLVGTISVNAATNFTVYFENTLGWSNVYVYFFKSNPWNNSNGVNVSSNIASDKGGQMTSCGTSSGSNPILSYDYAGTDDVKWIAFATSGDQYGYGQFNNNTVSYATKDAEFDSAKTLWTPSTTPTYDSSNKLNNCVYYNSGTWSTYGSGSGSGGGAAVTDENLLSVLKGEKVMFYFGDKWSSGIKYLRTGNKTGTVVEGTEDATYSYNINSATGTYYYKLATVASATYYISNSSDWEGVQMSANAEAGKAYILNTGIGGNDKNNIYTLATGTIEVSTSINDSNSKIQTGEKLSVSTPTAPGTSVLGNTNIIKYYIGDSSNSNYAEYTLTDGKLDTSSLNEGSYTLKTVLYDQDKLYVVADTDNFTVSDVATTYTINKGSEDSAKGTFSVDKTTAAENDAVKVTTSPASGYEVDTVTYTPDGGSPIIVSGINNTYTFNMPANNVTVNVTFKQTSTSDTITVYFKDTAGWSSVNCYAWNGSDKNKDYPGVAMSKVDGKENIYSIKLKNTYVNCIFSKGSDSNTKTSDLTINAGKMYDFSASAWVDYSDTPTPTTNYYIGGRFGESWNANSTKHPFASTDTTGLYKYDTGKTVSQLSAEYDSFPQYFIIHEGKDVYDKDAKNSFYCGEEVGEGDNKTGSLHNFQLAKNSSNAVKLTKYNDTNTTANRLIRFNDSGNTSTGAVTIWLDASDTSAMKLYYTVDGESDVSGTLKANSTVYATSSKKLDSITLTTKMNGEAVESAVTMTDAGNVNGIYYYSYKLTAAANAVQFDYSISGTAKTKTASCVEGKNVYSLDNDSWSVYEIDKYNAYTSGLWVDVQPSVVHTNIALIKWTNKKGNNGNDGNNYKLYIPGGVSLTLPVYSTASSVTINGKTVNDGDTFTFDTSSEYTVKIGSDSTEYKLKVMQSGSASLYTTTSADLPTASTGQMLEKTPYKNGGFMTVSNEGKIVNDVQTLAQIKGRGNSTWEASGKEYGKYAYNIKLASAINPLNKFDKDAKSKSFCLLANNADQSSLRNILAYNAATKAGVANTPNFEVIDVYNNGEYLGSYLITEKVDVALDKKLVEGDPVDEYHNYTYTDELRHKDAKYTYGSGTFEFSYVDTGSVAAGVDIETKSYLLEFDLMERAQAEHCWFKTPKGQYIALKTPEDLNEEEMRFIIRKWCEAEDAVYNKSYEEASKLVDMKSFAQVYLIQEWSKNLDSAATSYYIYYDGRQANPKWQATPIWDYDWAFGGHGDTKPVYKPNNDSDVNNYLDNYSGWFTKYKTIVQNDETILDKTWNFQAQLANNESFWNDVITVWNSGFYTSASAAISDLSTYYTNNSASYAMNEARYGFVGNSYFRTLWGSTDTGSTPDAAKTWLVNWATNRLNWMNEKLARTAQLSGVTISPDSASYTAGDTVTITATPQNPVGGAVITYQIFRKTETDADFVAGAVTSDGVFTFANANAGTYQYKVVATDAYGFTKESDVLKVTVSGVTGEHDVTIYFKSSSTYAYKPLLKWNNGGYVEMTKTETDLIGTNYSGSIKFYWYKTTLINVNSTEDNTITIKTAGTSASGSFTSKLDSTTYYFGIDDLMEGTELVDLSNQPEYIRNYHHTARHMVSSGLASDGTLGFTKVNGIRYQMGSYNPDEVTTVDTASVASVSNTLTTASSFSIKSATAVQMLNVEKAKASLLQTQLLDVNLDGIVDIKDATLIQKALAY